MITINPLTAAYLGDAIYELKIREYLINKNIPHVNELQQESLNYVSAKSQRKILESLIENNILTEEEIDIYKWGRNAKGHTNKTSDIETYRIATGLECLIGYLYLENKKERINEIINFVLK